jgi:hypothetical protein
MFAHDRERKTGDSRFFLHIRKILHDNWRLSSAPYTQGCYAWDSRGRARALRQPGFPVEPPRPAGKAATRQRDGADEARQRERGQDGADEAGGAGRTARAARTGADGGADGTERGGWRTRRGQGGRDGPDDERGGADEAKADEAKADKDRADKDRADEDRADKAGRTAGEVHPGHGAIIRRYPVPWWPHSLGLQVTGNGGSCPEACPAKAGL